MASIYYPTAARVGDSKLVLMSDYGSVSYDLKNDLEESNDLSKKDPLKHKKLLQAFKNWEKSMIEPLWEEGAVWQERNFEIHKNLMLNNYRTVDEMNAFNKKNKND